VAPDGLKVLATIVEHQPEDERNPYWVAGLVTKNPFYESDLPGALGEPGQDLTAHLRVTEVLLCDLSSWHPVGMSVTGYRLRHCEWGWTSTALVARVVADWDD
jgi:hypothetical protein